MKPSRTLEILTKLKAIHEANPHLAMTDMTNAEIIEALDIGEQAVHLLIEITGEALGKGGKNEKLD